MRFVIFFSLIFSSCNSGEQSGQVDNCDGASSVASVNNRIAKLNSESCTDPDLTRVSKSESFMLCDGSTGRGTLELVPEDIRAGVDILGVTGTHACDPPPDPWDLRLGITLGATTGRLKVNCRNMAGHYDGNGGYTQGSSTLHTVDDNNYDGSSAGSFPATNPWPEGDANFCGYKAPSESTWERVTTTPSTTGSNSIYLDKITGLQWSRGSDTTTYEWNDAAAAGDGALEYCAALSHGGIIGGNWRVPTQKELMEAYVHGIHELDNDHTPTDNLGDLDGSFWTSSTLSSDASYAWRVFLTSGGTTVLLKSSSANVLCVTP